MYTDLLIKKCLKNERAAQAKLYQLYAPAMLGVCYRYSKNKEDAEDILQEAFIKVFRNIQQFQQNGPFEAWLRRIMVNTAISYLRKHSRYRNELQVEEIGLHPISSENPEINLDIKDLIECIRALPTGYQTVFNLFAIEGFEHQEIAELLQMNINTVRSQYSRARALLITAIKQQEITIQSKSYGG
ncbi:MAG: RNA polymerase sigma factor [Chitinophagaceae bacterium]|nr:RNA polymerase sigma factor [Chitinophagaceae bacterium]